MKKRLVQYSPTIFAVLAFALLAPLPASAIDFTGLLALVRTWLNSLIGILIGIALIIFFWGLIRFIGAGDDAGRTEGKKRMGWGIIILFVMVSVWGIVNFISSSLQVQNTTAPPVPGLP